MLHFGCREAKDRTLRHATRGLRVTEGGPRADLSRVLYPVSGTVTICLGRDLRRVSSDRYPRTGRAAVTASSYLVLLRAGFTWPAGHPAAGGLLPHLFTLT